MFDLLTVILLGIVEGVTEFLPVSSTGHLILAGALLGFEGASAGTFEIVIQLGAILAVVVLYWRRFADVLAGLVRRSPSAWTFARNIALGFLPSAVIGLIVYKAVKAMLESPTIVAVALIVGGVAILAIERLAGEPRTESVDDMPWRTALGIGIVQCLSMIPGVSRSGATIMGALALGVERKAAAEFSFFLAVPTMAGATAYDLFKNRELITSELGIAVGIGFAAAFVVAYFVVRFLLDFIQRNGFAIFAYWRIFVGALGLWGILLFG